jgi:predicted Zn-dependent protease
MRWLLPALLILFGCAGSGDSPLYLHNRGDYEALRARFPRLLEPNYLPFMAARVVVPVDDAAFAAPRRWLAALLGAGTAADELLVFCRWPDEAFPLGVHVVPPRISDQHRDRLFPRPATEYVEAVERALALWEEGLERDLFEIVGDASAADLTIELQGNEAPTPDPSLQVLGATPLGDACRVEAGSGGSLTVRFSVAELRVFVADQHGLLLPDQVEHVALHEIGHALGMHGHSPIPNDLMFRVVRDRLPRGELGAEDVNSFLSLYAIPNGTVYAALPTEEPAGLEPSTA